VQALLLVPDFLQTSVAPAKNFLEDKELILCAFKLT